MQKKNNLDFYAYNQYISFRFLQIRYIIDI